MYVCMDVCVYVFLCVPASVFRRIPENRRLICRCRREPGGWPDLCVATLPADVCMVMYRIMLVCTVHVHIHVTLYVCKYVCMYVCAIHDAECMMLTA